VEDKLGVTMTEISNGGKQTRRPDVGARDARQTNRRLDAAFMLAPEGPLTTATKIAMEQRRIRHPSRGNEQAMAVCAAQGRRPPVVDVGSTSAALVKRLEAEHIMCHDRALRHLTKHRARSRRTCRQRNTSAPAHPELIERCSPPSHRLPISSIATRRWAKSSGWRRDRGPNDAP